MKPAMCRVCGKAEFGHTCAGVRVPILMSDEPPSKETRREAITRAIVSTGDGKPPRSRSTVQGKIIPGQAIADPGAASESGSASSVQEAIRNVVSATFAARPRKPRSSPIPISANAKLCTVCGKDFVPKRLTARYCSPRCRVAASRSVQ